MEDESISFLRYVKIAQDSDAFFYSSQFCPFIEIQLSTAHTNLPLEANYYTAGTTNDPEDYNLPETKNSVNPKKLIRINPFSSNSSDEISTYEFGSDEKIIQEEVYEPFVNDEAKRLLAYIKNKPKQKSKISGSSLVLSESNFSEHIFEIRPRAESEKGSFSYEENDNVTYSNGSKEKSNLIKQVNNKTENINKINNTQEFYTDIKNQRIEYNSGDINYDLNNQSFSTNIDISNNFNTTNIVNEIKTEIINEVNSSITKLENTFINQSITRNDIVKVENNIVKVIEEKMVERESKILEKIEEKNKKDLKSFSRDFLNS